MSQHKSQGSNPSLNPSSKQSSKQRPAKLGSSLDNKLLSYASAAAAAGVGVLALAQTSAAEVVFTRANETIGPTTYLDLNGDGINDFKFITTHTSRCAGLCTTSARRFHHKTAFESQDGKLAVYGSVAGNEVFGTVNYAAALRINKRVGPPGEFPGGNKVVRVFGISSNSNQNFVYGPWGGANLKGLTAYVGFKFLISGEVHYGWARIKVIISKGAHIQATLTGYAYDTIPNHFVITGQISGDDSASNLGNPIPSLPESTASVASLGRLAQGASGLAAWRREEESVLVN
jgi:hypothetical protein